ncbi:MAG: 1-(5-phosphoribosyl)-5-[(5-phosphoribosylamino)methylideneamino]imidazole-4-carboxamide isomerase [Cytophagales bacterium]|nr:1-(5-phosphoribosyl)-5-[(5-phosphoribosylamino)methylideneamino]imidazole-4-carboxamide isomerase [Cytophagales bacterium]
MHIIPAIDIINGQCVRLTKGDYEQQTTYHDNPVEVAKSFEAAGLNRLHLVDLDGAKSKHIVNEAVLEAITRETSLTVDFGGGLKTDADLQQAFASGATQITGGSIAAKDRETFLNWIKNYGGEKIILGADVLNEKIMVSGWQETSELGLFEFLEFYLEQGLEYVICTDISKDGMLTGPAVGLYKKILDHFPAVKLIASGGVSSMEDLHALREAGLFGAIVGKAIYEGKVTLEQLSAFQSQN